MPSAFEIQLHAALHGDFDAEVEKGRVRTEAAMQAAVFDFGGELQGKWRQDFAQSGLANAGRLGKTVRLKRYRNSGLDPAVLVYSTMPKVTAAFEAGATITVNGKLGALVPNPDVWPGRRVRRPSGRGSSTTTFQVAVRRFGDLQFVATPGHGDLVGVYLAKLSGTGRRAARRLSAHARGGRIVVFYVMHEPRLPKALHGAEIRRRARANAPGRIQQLFVQHFEAADGPRLLTGPAE